MTQKGKISNGVKLRKFFIWFISFAAVLAIYLLYNQISETPQIDIDTGTESADAVTDSNAGLLDGEIGMVGDVAVATVRKARFTDLNDQKQVEREFGFERLLHESGNEWEIEKPFMNIFRHAFNCSITADRGRVQVETAVGKPSPKDATLTGNVVIHILPRNESSIEESFIYLDDVTFISEMSQFSTAGPVRFVSQDALMLGRGLELVYNDQAERLEFLRIIHLDSLTLRSSSKPSLLPQTTRRTEHSAKAGQSSSDQTDVKTLKRSATEVDNRPAVYRCLLSKNVVIDGPQQLIFADEVFINDVLWLNPPDKKSKSGAPLMKRQAKPEPQATNNEQRASSISAGHLTVEHRDTKNEESADVIVTCDGGIFVTPMDSPRAPGSSAKIGVEMDVTDRSAESLNDTSGRPVFVAQRIDYSASTGDTVASGPSRLKFYVDDVTGIEAEQDTIPVKVTAREKARFLPALNQVIFEGDCLCTTEFRVALGAQRKYRLSAPRVTIDLTGDETPDIKHVTAEGGAVQLDTSKWKGEELLGFVKLKCRKFDYDRAQQMFLAAGPGLIAVDNSKIAKPKRKTGRFSLRRPCYAVVRDFESLQYSLKVNRIIADATRQRILIDYFPFAKGRPGQQVKATAGGIKARLKETKDGRNELSALSATGGVSYEEENVQFMGSEFFYDAGKSMIRAWGSEFQPCQLNGAFVDGIEYNLKTGRAKSKIVAPGALQMR